MVAMWVFAERPAALIASGLNAPVGHHRKMPRK